MPQFIDQLQRTIALPGPPNRIISLVPSQTELLVDLGLRDKLVGITKFCVHPNGLKKEKVVIGGTKNFHFDKIDALRPDLIIANKEENYKEGIEKLAGKYPVWISDINNLEDAYQMILSLGEMTGSIPIASQIVADIRKGLDKDFHFKGTAVYLIWNEPLIAVGSDTYIDSMLEKAGFKNIIQQRRYPEIRKEDLFQLNPDYLLLSSEPFPFREKHLTVFRDILPKSNIRIVDGEMFSWYGSRLLRSAKYFETF
ncbi:ABC-type Fe3+-hydroxamate transport system, periplasmic component [Mariniradius saccharolyticus AK6]|uniref:ABC-type Fe3+-hydroxamate transport system, periplasmic component n=1 Tax=Mariniradius saccharolyticus AK6 TaxID=1239962 RepID=M7XR36_9BACT|nr:helical backbone metal receptor [Mariniradius saccharolyticus]EMS31027.1 ABC-type Fe3+-hydroxamate transport system, periplasmic component [Mariniradius saccharolyticus AK6]